MWSQWILRQDPKPDFFQGNKARGFLMCSLSVVSLTAAGSKGRLFIQEIFTDSDYASDTVEDTNDTGTTRTDVTRAPTRFMGQSIFAWISIYPNSSFIS